MSYGSGRELGCFAYPVRAKAPLPAVLVLQEARGVDAPSTCQSIVRTLELFPFTISACARHRPTERVG